MSQGLGCPGLACEFGLSQLGFIQPPETIESKKPPELISWSLISLCVSFHNFSDQIFRANRLGLRLVGYVVVFLYKETHIYPM